MQYQFIFDQQTVVQEAKEQAIKELGTIKAELKRPTVMVPGQVVIILTRGQVVTVLTQAAIIRGQVEITPGQVATTAGVQMMETLVFLTLTFTFVPFILRMPLYAPATTFR